MISKENFIKMLSILQSTIERSEELNRLFKLDLIEYDENYHKVIDILFASIFNESQLDWFNWWLYERVPPTGGKILEAFDETGKEIIFVTSDQLYDFLMTLK